MLSSGLSTFRSDVMQRGMTLSNFVLTLEAVSRKGVLEIGSEMLATGVSILDHGVHNFHLIWICRMKYKIKTMMMAKIFNFNYFCIYGLFAILN